VSYEKKHCRFKHWQAWRAHSSQVRTTYGLSKKTAPWSARASTRLRGVPELPRVRDLVDVLFGIRQKKLGPLATTREVTHELFADLSVSVARVPMKIGSPHTFRKNSFCYSYEHDCVLSGSAQLQCMGWPRSEIASLPDSELRALSGEVYSLPIASMFHFALFCNPYAPWWGESE